jgi:hypothetical protein
VITDTIRVMADTKRTSTRHATHPHHGDDVPTEQDPKRRDADHPDTTGTAPSLSTTDQNPPSTPRAFSYAGSGTTDPVELNPATHGAHYRGTTGDV